MTQIKLENPLSPSLVKHLPDKGLVGIHLVYTLGIHKVIDKMAIQIYPCLTILEMGYPQFKMK